MDLSRRNGQAAEEALKRMDLFLRQQELRVNGLHATVVTLMNKINALEQMITTLRAAAMGHGPTT